MGPLGWQETVFIFILALLVFGPKKLPELGKTLGKAMTEFRRASSELKSTFDREMSNLERETEIKEVAASVNNSVGYDYNYDSYSYDSGSNENGSGDPTATSSSTTASASAPQGAQSTVPAETPAAATEPIPSPEGTIAHTPPAPAVVSDGAGVKAV